MLSGKLDSRGYKLYDSFYMTFWKKDDYRDRKRIYSCQGKGTKGEIFYRRAQESLVGMVLFYVLIVIVVTQLCVFSRTDRTIRQKG